MTGVEEAARVLCDSDDSMEHHDQTDDHPCSRCVRYADALDRNDLLAQPTADEAEGDAGLRERVETLPQTWRARGDALPITNEHNYVRKGLWSAAADLTAALAADTPTPAPEGSGLGGGDRD